MANGEWRMANGDWRMANGAEDGPVKYASANEECFALHGAGHFTGERLRRTDC